MVALEPYIERDGTAAGSNVIMDLVNDAPNVSFEIEHIERGEWFSKPKSYAHCSFLQSKLLGAKLLLLVRLT